MVYLLSSIVLFKIINCSLLKEVNGKISSCKERLADYLLNNYHWLLIEGVPFGSLKQIYQRYLPCLKDCFGWKCSCRLR